MAGKKNISKLVKKVIVNKNGKRTTVYVKVDKLKPKKSTFNYDEYDLHLWGKSERELFLRYDEIKDAKTINSREAALLVAVDKKLFKAVQDYKYENKPLENDLEQRLIKIISKVKSVDKVFFRGVEREKYDDDHVMKVQSWTPSKDTAEIFGDYVYKTIEPSKGVEIGDIYYMNGLINDDSDGFGDSQAEWLLLNPKKELIKD